METCRQIDRQDHVYFKFTKQISQNGKQVAESWFRIWDGKSYNIVVSSAKQSWCTESSMTSSTFLLRTTLPIPAQQPEATGPGSWYLTAPWMPTRAPSFPQQYVFGTLCLSPQLQHRHLMPSRAASALDQPSKPDKMFLTCMKNLPSHMCI